MILGLVGCGVQSTYIGNGSLFSTGIQNRISGKKWHWMRSGEGGIVPLSKGAQIKKVVVYSESNDNTKFRFRIDVDHDEFRGHIT